MRKRELSGMVEPYIDVTVPVGELICSSSSRWARRVRTIPRTRYAVICSRTFSIFCYDARRAIMESQFSVAFPLLRRAFESISLLAACAVDVGFAETWASAKQIPNVKVRARLSNDPIQEPLESTRELYKYFSMGAHPNRDVVPFRFLGKANQFVLGAIGRPDLLVFCDHLRHHLSLWFWFCAAVTFHYRELTDLEYGEKYLKVASDAKEVGESLLNEIKRLRSNPFSPRTIQRVPRDRRGGLASLSRACNASRGDHITGAVAGGVRHRRPPGPVLPGGVPGRNVGGVGAKGGASVHCARLRCLTIA